LITLQLLQESHILHYFALDALLQTFLSPATTCVKPFFCSAKKSSRWKLQVNPRVRADPVQVLKDDRHEQVTGDQNPG